MSFTATGTKGRSQHDALRKVWKELESGCEWVVDGDLSDFFGTVDHSKLYADGTVRKTSA